MHDGNWYEKNVRNNQLICAKKLSFLFVPFHDYLREINTVCVFLYFNFWQNYYHKFWLCNDDVSLSVRLSVNILKHQPLYQGNQNGYSLQTVYTCTH